MVGGGVWSHKMQKTKPCQLCVGVGLGGEGVAVCSWCRITSHQQLVKKFPELFLKGRKRKALYWEQMVYFDYMKRTEKASVNSSAMWYPWLSRLQPWRWLSSAMCHRQVYYLPTFRRNVLPRKSRCLLWEPYGTHRYTVWAECRVCTSQEIHYVSATKPNRLMLSGETLAVYCENHTEHTDTLCGQNGEF
jgi:hypothetical protein